MNEKYRTKQYFHGFVILLTIFFTFLTILGDAIFLIVGLTVGLPNHDIEMILSMLFSLFLFAEIVMLLTADRYWWYDDEGIVNGLAFYKRKILFKDVDRAEIKDVILLKFPEYCLVLYKKRRHVLIPKWFLKKEDIEWIQNHISVEIVDKTKSFYNP